MFKKWKIILGCVCIIIPISLVGVSAVACSNTKYYPWKTPDYDMPKTITAQWLVSYLPTDKTNINNSMFDWTDSKNYSYWSKNNDEYFTYTIRWMLYDYFKAHLPTNKGYDWGYWWQANMRIDNLKQIPGKKEFTFNLSLISGHYLRKTTSDKLLTLCGFN